MLLSFEIKKLKREKLEIIKFLKKALNFIELYEIKECEVILICSDEDRGLDIDGYAYSPIIDSLNDKFKKNGISTQIVSTPSLKQSKIKRYGTVKEINSLYLRSLIKKKIKSLFFKAPRNRIDFEEDLWRKVLKKANPRAIIGIQPSPSLCVAAKKLSIWIADIQHGVISREGYYGEKYRSNYECNSWPSSILCWDEDSQLNVHKITNKKIETIITGNPWVARLNRTDTNDSLANNLIKKYKVNVKKNVIILITLQWGYERISEIDKSGIPSALLAYIKSRGEKIDWWIRIHPVQLRGNLSKPITKILKEEFAGYSNIFWDAPTKAPLPILMESVDLHMTWSSAATIEASWFGIKTALLSTDVNLLKEWFSEKIEKNIAEIVCLNENQIAFWIENNSTLVRSKNELAYNQYELIENFIQKIDKLCKSEKIIINV